MSFVPGVLGALAVIGLEHAAGFEPALTGFADRRLNQLGYACTSWSGRRDSNSRSEFGRLACFQLHHSRRANDERGTMNAERFIIHRSDFIVDLEPPIGLEPIPDSFEANRSSVKLRGHV